jgi:hypothetical protein
MEGMKTVTLYAYEFERLLEALRGDMRHHEQCPCSGDAQRCEHEMLAHQDRSLLDIINPKKPTT